MTECCRTPKNHSIERCRCFSVESEPIAARSCCFSWASSETVRSATRFRSSFGAPDHQGEERAAHILVKAAGPVFVERLVSYRKYPG